MSANPRRSESRRGKKRMKILDLCKCIWLPCSVENPYATAVLTRDPDLSANTKSQTEVHCCLCPSAASSIPHASGARLDTSQDSAMTNTFRSISRAASTARFVAPIAIHPRNPRPDTIKPLSSPPIWNELDPENASGFRFAGTDSINFQLSPWAPGFRLGLAEPASGSNRKSRE